MKINRFNESLDFEQIVDILQEIEDESHDVVKKFFDSVEFYLKSV